MSDIDKVIGSYEHAIQSADWADTTAALAVVASARLELANLRRRAQGVDVEAVIEHVRSEYKRECWGTLLPELESVLRRALARETGAA